MNGSYQAAGAEGDSDFDSEAAEAADPDAVDGTAVDLYTDGSGGSGSGSGGEPPTPTTTTPP